LYTKALLSSRYKVNAMLVKKGLQAREKIYRRLKSHLISGNVRPGGKLRQEELAEKLQVSRTPIREALHRLESEGLIERADTGGFRVSHLSAHELEELFDIRSVLEGFSARFACRVVSEDNLDMMEEFVEKSQQAHRKGQAEEIFYWNTELHDTIHNIIGQRRRFQNLISNMRDYILRYRMDTLHHLDLAQKSINAHRKILLAFRLKDSNLAEYMMRLHIQESKEDAMRITFGDDYRALLGYPDAGSDLTCIVLK
jgi:DNA-binding GntR family transcriptional regulator